MIDSLKTDFAIISKDQGYSNYGNRVFVSYYNRGKEL